MPRILLIHIILILQIILISNCNTNDIPKSVQVSNDSVTFTLKNNNYDRVVLSYNFSGQWYSILMEQQDDQWVATLFNPHKIIKYKFLVNGTNLIMDPLNKNLDDESFSTLFLK